MTSTGLANRLPELAVHRFFQLSLYSVRVYPQELQWLSRGHAHPLRSSLLQQRQETLEKALAMPGSRTGVDGGPHDRGIFGMTHVESTQWSGLPLTLLLAVFGLTAAYPLGVILALGRRSKMPAVKIMSILYIELIRGVPLISLLFMSSIIFPCSCLKGLRSTRFCGTGGHHPFHCATLRKWFAEGCRGSPGQYEAAESLD